MFRTLRRKVFRLAAVSGIGAAANYFLDRDRGPVRRAAARSRADSLLRRRSTGAARRAEYAANAFDTAPAPAPADLAGGPGPVSTPTVSRQPSNLSDGPGPVPVPAVSRRP